MSHPLAVYLFEIVFIFRDVTYAYIHTHILQVTNVVVNGDNQHL